MNNCRIIKLYELKIQVLIIRLRKIENKLEKKNGGMHDHSLMEKKTKQEIRNIWKKILELELGADPLK